MASVEKEVQIAIDGPAASGKSTVAKKIAAALNGYYVNTGDMYRCLTMVCQDKGIEIGDTAESVDLDAVKEILAKVDIRYKRGEGAGELILTVDGEPAEAARVRAPEVAKCVSQIAAIPAVREWLVERQRESRELGLIVMEGRDIGTVVFPEAAHKFFVTATPEERARRRLAQPGETVDGATLAAVAAEIAKRDKMDSERKVSPLRPAEDATLVDTTELTIDQVVEKIAGLIKN